MSTNRSIGVTPEDREELDRIAGDFGFRHISVTVTQLIAFWRRGHCPECQGAVPLQTCPCKAQERL
jgi:hypothetical protein